MQPEGPRSLVSVFTELALDSIRRKLPFTAVTALSAKRLATASRHARRHNIILYSPLRAFEWIHAAGCTPSLGICIKNDPFSNSATTFARHKERYN